MAPVISPADVAGMRLALDQAREAGRRDEVPVGAVVVRDNVAIASAGNEALARNDPTAHAEFLAIQRALAVTGNGRLTGATLYVTLEPCAQCAGAIVLARVGRVVFGAWDPKAGMAGSIEDLVRHPRLNHRPEVLGGVLEAESAELLQGFFRERR